MTKNSWKHMDDAYWMCFLYDVWLEYGVWKASFYVGRQFEKTFKSAEDAMRYCDQL